MTEPKSGKLSVWQLVMLALGSSVGGSYFLSTAIPLKTVGPGILVTFAIGGLMAYIILMALSEMTTARPTNGSFREYAEVAFGPMASFLVGWVYWAGLALAMSSEAVAVALFARLWVPFIPVWILSLAVVLIVTGINLLDVRLFSAVESGMSAIKLLAIAAFAVLMAAVIIGLMPGHPPVGLGAVRSEPFVPGGWGGLAGSMLLILFSYAGFEVVGLAAPDARDPKRTVPKAIVLTVLALVGLYVLGFVVILPLLPAAAARPDVSPMILTLQHTGFLRLAGWLNLIIMSASLSTMLAAMYGLSRMLQSLAEERQAPAAFARLTAAGAPRNALLASSGAMLVGVALAYMLPKQVYLLLVSSGGFSLLFAYLVILASQLRIRRREGCPMGHCQLPFYPYSTWLGIILLIGAMAAMPLVPGQGAGLATGLGLVAAFALAYWLTRARTRTGPGSQAPAGTEPKRVETTDPGVKTDDRVPVR